MDHPIQLSRAVAGEPVWPYRGPLSTAGIENLRDGQMRSTRSSFRIQIGNAGWSWSTGAPATLAGDLAEAGLRGDTLRKAVAHQAAPPRGTRRPHRAVTGAGNRILLDPHDKDHYGVPLPRIRYDIGGYARGRAGGRPCCPRAYLRQAQLHGDPPPRPGFRVRDTFSAPAAWETIRRTR